MPTVSLKSGPSKYLGLFYTDGKWTVQILSWFVQNIYILVSGVL